MVSIITNEIAIELKKSELISKNVKIIFPN